VSKQAKGCGKSLVPIKDSGAFVGTVPRQEPCSTPEAVCSANQECYTVRASNPSQESQVKYQARVSDDVDLHSDVPVRVSKDIYPSSDILSSSSVVKSLVPPDHVVKSPVVPSLSSVQVCRPVEDETSIQYPSSVQVRHPVQDETSIPYPSPVQVGRLVEDETPVSPEEVEDEALMYVAAHVKNCKLDVLIDSGTTASYINAEVVKRLKIPTSIKREINSRVWQRSVNDLYSILSRPSQVG